MACWTHGLMDQITACDIYDISLHWLLSIVLRHSLILPSQDVLYFVNIESLLHLILRKQFKFCCFRQLLLYPEVSQLDSVLVKGFRIEEQTVFMFLCCIYSHNSTQILKISREYITDICKLTVTNYNVFVYFVCCPLVVVVCNYVNS